MKLIARIGLVLALFLVAASCSVDQLKQHYWSQGIDPGQYSEADLQIQADAITAYMFEQADLHKFDWVLSDGQLFNLRWCESTDNYQAVSAGGTYRGAYQFSQSTWNWVAGTHHPKYVGEDPRWAAPEVQDAMTRALWYMQGPAPWPVCGYRV
jgi:hypothetical protein